MQHIKLKSQYKLLQRLDCKLTRSENDEKMNYLLDIFWILGAAVFRV